MLNSVVFVHDPSSISLTALYVATLLWMVALGVGEVVGKHLQYSKFWNSPSNKSKQFLLSSKIGMLVLYTPALLVGISSFPLVQSDGIRFLFLKIAITLHFLKRDLEVLFLHKFSGFMGLKSVIMISLTYFSAAVGMVYFQYLTQGVAEPSIDLKYVGVLVFLVGISGNFYHHYLLAKIRRKGEKEYKIPSGGLFGWVVCPHYLFEILSFIGMALISQTVFSCMCAFGSAAYLLGRSYSTRKWYISKFDDFPKNVKALIPYVF